MALTPGTRLGAYEITAPVGEGGMGQVYRARDVKLRRDVAIKILPEAFAHDADRLARFQREAEVLASLTHPNAGQRLGHGVAAEEALARLAVPRVLSDRQAPPLPYFVRANTPARTGLYVQRLGSPERTLLMPTLGRGAIVSSGTDGLLLFMREHAVLAQRLDLDALAWRASRCRSPRMTAWVESMDAIRSRCQGTGR